MMGSGPDHGKSLVSACDVTTESPSQLNVYNENVKEALLALIVA